MGSNRRGYAGMLLLSLLLLLWTESGFLAAVCVMELLLPLLIGIMLKLEAHGFYTEWNVKAFCEMGQELILQIDTERKRTFGASGILQIELMMYNRMLDDIQKEKLCILPEWGNTRLEYRIPTETCGLLLLKCEKMELYDLFGLCRVSLPFLPEKRIVVYPGKISLQLSQEAGIRREPEGTQYPLGRKGSDASEPFDMRSYHAGDDIRSIHWKLSAKVASILVREFSDAARYDTLLAVDAGKTSEGHSLSPELVSASISFASSVSREFVKQGFAHVIAITERHRFYDFPVSDQKEFRRVLDQWMCMQIPEYSGRGIPYLKTGFRRFGCRKMLYVTAGVCPDEVSELSADLDVTAVCLQEEGDETVIMQQAFGWLIKIPYRLLDGQTNRVIF